MKPSDFWPFAEHVVCVRCHTPVKTAEAIAVVDGGNLGGMAHERCPGG